MIDVQIDFWAHFIVLEIIIKLDTVLPLLLVLLALKLSYVFIGNQLLTNNFLSQRSIPILIALRKLNASFFLTVISS